MALAGPHYHRPGVPAWPGWWPIAKQLDGVDALLATDSPHLVLRAYPLDAAVTAADAAQALITAGLLALPQDRGIAQIGTEATSGKGVAWNMATINALGALGWHGRVAIGGWSVGNPASSTIPGCDAHFADAVALGPVWTAYPGRVVLGFDEYVSILPSDARWASWVLWTGRRHTPLPAYRWRPWKAARIVASRYPGARLPAIGIAGGGQMRTTWRRWQRLTMATVPTWATWGGVILRWGRATSGNGST